MKITANVITRQQTKAGTVGTAKMTSPTLAHRELTTKHLTMTTEGRDGRVTCRKTNGQYIVTVERYQPSNINRMVFKTLRGALIAYDNVKGLI